MRIRNAVAVLALSLVFAVSASPVLHAGSQMASYSKAFNVGPGGNVIVDVAGGDVSIRTGSANVQVDVVGLAQSDLANLQVNQSGNAVYIVYKPERSSSSSPRFEVTVPSSFNLDLKTAGGDIEVLGDLSGEVKGKTSGGDIAFQNIDGGVDLKTSGGDIEGQTVRGNVNLATSGGDIKLASADGEVTVKTAGGDIEVGNVGSRLSAKTAGGDIKLGDVGGAVEAQTAGGDVVVGAVSGNADLSTAGGDIKLASSTGPVTAKTAGGNLDLREVASSIEGKTSGGDIYAEIVGNPGAGNELATAGGDIELRVGTGVGLTIHAVIGISGNWERESGKVGISSSLVQVNPVKDADAREIRADFPVNGGGPDVNLKTVNGNIKVNAK